MAIAIIAQLRRARVVVIAVRIYIAAVGIGNVFAGEVHACVKRAGIPVVARKRVRAAALGRLGVGTVLARVIDASILVARIAVGAVLVLVAASLDLVVLTTKRTLNRTVLQRAHIRGADVDVIAIGRDHATTPERQMQALIVDASVHSARIAIEPAAQWWRVAVGGIRPRYAFALIEAQLKGTRMIVGRARLARTAVAFVRHQHVVALAVQAVVQRADVIRTGRPVPVCILLPESSRRAILGLLAALQSLRLLLFNALEFELTEVSVEVTRGSPTRSGLSAIGIVFAALV